jgi:predicted aspartyl protease
MRAVCSAILLCVGVFAGSPAVAGDDCPPLTMVTSVQMHIAEDGRVYVPAKINDTPKSMLVDTGGLFTEITQPALDELKLGTRETRLELVGISGDTTRRAARAAFTLGNLHADSMDFMVMPSVHQFASDADDVAGILAPNLLRSYDLDLDFGGHKVNLISQRHCEGKVVYWPADAVAVVPVTVNANGHILVPVELDGHKLTALLDTGATISVLNLEVAEGSFGLTPGGADTPVRGNLLGSRQATTYSHRFKSLALEGISISNPTLEIVPDLMRTQMLNPHDSLEGDTRIPDKNVETGLGDMILGMDILRRLHVYIAYKERNLYITPANPVAAGGTTPSSAAAASSASK